MSQVKKPVIDVVIPAHEKDLETLNHCIKGIRKYGASVRRIIVISKERYTHEAEWFDEAHYPFSFQDISELVSGNAVGWHFQQLLKMYAPLVIPDISENVLILDADTVFLRPVSFFSNEGIPLYNLSKDKNLESSPFHQVTLKHIKKILPEIAEKLPEEVENISGICHHMIFQKHMIEELFARVESYDGQGDPFYKVFLKTAEQSFGVAEYNLYFYFLRSLHPGKYHIRILKYKNTSDFQIWKYRWRLKYHYCSFHSYMRKDEKGFVRKVAEKLFKKIKRFFFVEQWNLGILDFPVQDILNKKVIVKWLHHPGNLKAHCDPMGIEVDGKKIIIFEDYSHIKKRGIISIAHLNEQLELVNKKVLLDDKNHVSYPFLFNHEGVLYFLCESYKANKLSLYELDSKTLTVKKVRDIFQDRKIIDPTIFYYQEKFWMFYMTEHDTNARLHIAFSDSLLGEFKEHPHNPVKVDSFSARPAGALFVHNGDMYRPAQNCTKVYGGSIIINRITTLSETEFSEEFVKEIKDVVGSSYNCGMHSINAFNGMTLVDGKRMVFLPYKPFISIVRNLIRFFSTK